MLLCRYISYVYIGILISVQNLHIEAIKPAGRISTIFARNFYEVLCVIEDKIKKCCSIIKMLIVHI